MIKVAAPVGVAQELVPVCIFHLFWPKSLGENNWSNGRRILFSSIILSSLVYAHPFFVQQFEGPAILIQNFCLGHHNSSSFCSPLLSFSPLFLCKVFKGNCASGRTSSWSTGISPCLSHNTATFCTISLAKLFSTTTLQQQQQLALVPVCHTTRLLCSALGFCTISLAKLCSNVQNCSHGIYTWIGLFRTTRLTNIEVQMIIPMHILRFK